MPTIDAATVRAVFEADIADLVRNTARAADAVESMASKSDTSAKKMSHGIGVAGAAIAAALGMAAKASIDNTLAFEKSMTSISALVGATDDEMAQYTDTVRRVGTETGVGAKQAADALYFLTSSGLDAAKSQDALEITAKAAAAGLGEQAQVADAVSSAMNAYSMSGMTASKATDIMVAAVREGKVEASEFAAQIGTAIPQAAQLGIRFDEVSAAVAGMSLTGIKAGEAVTRLEYAMRSIGSPSVRAEKVLANFGLSGEMLRATIREKGLLAAMEQLREAFKGNEDQLVRGLGSIQAYQAVMALTGENADQVKQVFAEVAESSGDLNTAFEKVAETSGHKMKVAMAELQEASLDVGATLLPVAATVVSSLSGIVSGFTDMSTGAQIGSVALLGILPAISTAGKAIEGLSGVWGGLQKAFAGGAMAGPVGLGLTAAAAGAAYIYLEMKKSAEEARDRQQALTQALIDGADPTTIATQKFAALVDSMEPIPAAAGDAAAALTDELGGSAYVADQVGEKWGETFGKIGQNSKTMFDLIKSGTDIFEKSGSALIDSFGDPIEKSLERATAAEREFVMSLVEGLETGKLTRKEVSDMIEVMDQLADSSDDAKEAQLDLIKSKIGKAISEDHSGVISTIANEAIAWSTASTELGKYEDAQRAVSAAIEARKPVEMGAETEGITDAAQATLDLEQAEKDAAEEAGALEKAIKDLGKEIDGYLGTMFNVPAAMDEVQGALLGMAAAIAENGSSTHGMTEEAIKTRDILRGWTSDVGDLIGAMQEQGATVEDQTATLAGLAGMYGDTMRAAGLSEEEIAVWTATVLAIPVGNPGLLAQERLLRDAGKSAQDATTEVDGVGAAVDSLNGKSATVTVSADVSAAWNAVQALNQLIATTTNSWILADAGSMAGGLGVNSASIGQMAEGGHIGPGDITTVGEEGPEFAVGRNGGVDIIPMGKIAGSSMGASSGGGMSKSGGGDTYIIQAHPDSRGQYEGRRVYDGLTREKRRRGGELAVTG